MSRLQPIVAQYFVLLNEAWQASTAVDTFDLVSDNPDSLAEWNRLRDRQREANTNLVEYANLFPDVLLPSFRYEQ